MSQVSLSQNKKSALEQRDNFSNNGKERDRIKAVLLRSEGWTLEMISQALRIHVSSISRHLEDYLELEKLAIESGGSGSRTRINIVSDTVRKLSDAASSQFKNINSENMVIFLETLRWENKNTGTIHLVLDGAEYHRALIVNAKAQELDIKLHYLPPYSPNLNSIEQLWKVMNEKVRNNYCFHSAKEFRQKINHFFDNVIPEIGDSLDARINDNFKCSTPHFQVDWVYKLILSS